MEIDWKDGHQSSWNFAGCAMPVLAPLAMRSAELPAASRVSRSRGRQSCCRCTKRRRGRSPLLPSAAMPSAFDGTTATRAEFTPGIISAAIANASSAAHPELCPNAASQLLWSHHRSRGVVFLERRPRSDVASTPIAKPLAQILTQRKWSSVAYLPRFSGGAPLLHRSPSLNQAMKVRYPHTCRKTRQVWATQACVENRLGQARSFPILGDRPQGAGFAGAMRQTGRVCQSFCVQASASAAFSTT